jgi:hypothetical protein
LETEPAQSNLLEDVVRGDLELDLATVLLQADMHCNHLLDQFLIRLPSKKIKTAGERNAVLQFQNRLNWAIASFYYSEQRSLGGGCRSVNGLLASGCMFPSLLSL